MIPIPNVSEQADTGGDFDPCESTIVRLDARHQQLQQQCTPPAGAPAGLFGKLSDEDKDREREQERVAMAGGVWQRPIAQSEPWRNPQDDIQRVDSFDARGGHQYPGEDSIVAHASQTDGCEITHQEKQDEGLKLALRHLQIATASFSVRNQ